MMNPGSLSTSIFGTLEHVGTPKSYLPIYNTHIFIYFDFRYKKYMKIGFLVFHVFRWLKIKGSSEHVRWPVGVFGCLQAAFFMSKR